MKKTVSSLLATLTVVFLLGFLVPYRNNNFEKGDRFSTTNAPYPAEIVIQDANYAYVTAQVNAGIPDNAVVMESPELRDKCRFSFVIEVDGVRQIRDFNYCLRLSTGHWVKVTSVQIVRIAGISEYEYFVNVPDYSSSVSEVFVMSLFWGIARYVRTTF